MKKVDLDWEVYFDQWYEREEIKNFLSSFYITKLINFLEQRKKQTVIYPNHYNVFAAFKSVKPKDLKIVILGQDPYPDGTATGLAFANHPLSTSISPSLRKIFERLEHDYNIMELDKDCTLSLWGEQGVMLLNTALTVEHRKPGSHATAWDHFTKFMINYIATNMVGTIFMLWGKHAQQYAKFELNGREVDLSKTCHVLTAEHPAYAARQGRLWECDNFIKANKIIEEANGKEFCIEW